MTTSFSVLEIQIALVHLKRRQQSLGMSIDDCRKWYVLFIIVYPFVINNMNLSQGHTPPSVDHPPIPAALYSAFVFKVKDFFFFYSSSSIFIITAINIPWKLLMRQAAYSIFYECNLIWSFYQAHEEAIIMNIILQKT